MPNAFPYAFQPTPTASSVRFERWGRTALLVLMGLSVTAAVGAVLMRPDTALPQGSLSSAQWAMVGLSTGFFAVFLACSSYFLMQDSRESYAGLDEQGQWVSAIRQARCSQQTLLAAAGRLTENPIAQAAIYRVLDADHPGWRKL